MNDPKLTDISDEALAELLGDVKKWTPGSDGGPFLATFMLQMIQSEIKRRDEIKNTIVLTDKYGECVRVQYMHGKFFFTADDVHLDQESTVELYHFLQNRLTACGELL